MMTHFILSHGLNCSYRNAGTFKMNLCHRHLILMTQMKLLILRSRYRTRWHSPIEKFSKKFRFPIPQEFSSGRRPAPAEVNKFIRECVACLQAQEGITLGTETLRMGAQVICTRVPILRDPKPPGFPKDKMFPYWVKY